MYEMIREILERQRRIETRLVKLMQHEGAETTVTRPVWCDGVVQIPSLHCSIKECLLAVPEDWPASRAIVVMQGDDEVMTVRVGL